MKMLIEKEIVSKVSRDYIFITSLFDIDSQYFKKRIEEGIKTSTLNYKTNVVGKHTAWRFFNNDKKLQTVLLQMIDHLESLNTNLDTFHLEASWGLIEKFGDYTKTHHHAPAYLSGVLYLNDHSQKLYF